MIFKIRKRDGRLVAFDEIKITDAIFKSFEATGEGNRAEALALTVEVLKMLEKNAQNDEKNFDVEYIQDIVEQILIEKGYVKTAKAYILYRDGRTRIREAKSDLMDAVADILVETSRENANISNSPSAKMLQIASAASKSYYLNRLIPREMALAHIEGDIHIHDLDFYGKTLTCVQIPLARLLKEGFNNGHGFIRPPKRPSSATALAAIILQSSQNDMHGGQSFAFFDRDMSSFLEKASDNEAYQAMEALVYNLNSMHSRAGAQVPFSSINLGTDTSYGGRLATKALLLAYERGLGHGESPVFPNIIFKVKKGINFFKEDPNYDLFQLAMRVAAKRLNPNFSFMDSSFNVEYGDKVAYMGCRTRVMANRLGKAETDGRGNLSFTTINLPRIAIRAEKNEKIFYNILKEVICLVGKQLYHRFTVQANLKVKDMPFLMGQKLYYQSEKLSKNEKIENAIKHGTLSVGFIGLAETLQALFGKHHGEDDEMQKKGLEIVAFMREQIENLSDEYNLNYTLLATPAESLSGRFLNLDKKRFGVLKNITDKDYYTNSFHVPVSFKISAKEKILKEGPYHKYTNAGHISYVEFASSPENNIVAVESLLRYMQECDMGYVGINFPVDFCENCKYLGTINDDICPACGDSYKRKISISGCE